MIIREKSIGSVIHNVFIYNYAVGKDASQRPILATVVNGNPGQLYVFNLEDFSCLFKVSLENAQGAMNLEITKEGIIVVGTFDNGGIYLVNPVRETVNQFENVIEDSFVYGLADDVSYIYGGGFPNCKLWRMTKNEYEIEPIITIDTNEKYLRSIIKDEEYFYLGVGTHPKFYKFNISNQELTEIDMGEDLKNISGSVLNLKDTGDHIIGVIDRINYIFVYTKLNEEVRFYKNYHDFVYLANKIYMFYGKKIDVLSLNDNTVTHFANNFTQSYRKVSLLTKNNKKSFITITGDGQLILYDIKNKELHIKKLDIDGEQTIIQSIKSSSNGLIFLGGYQSGGLTILDSDTEHFDEYKGIHQIEGMTFKDNEAFLGVYPGGHLYKCTLSEDGKDNYLEYLFQIGDEQDRPFAMENTEGKIFIGTVPISGILGGALTVYSTTDSKRQTYRNLIESQSIVSLVYHKGLLYGGTSIWGGMGQKPVAKEAKVFIWDVEKEKLIHSFVPIPGEKAITDLVVDHGGYLWGLTRTLLFKLNPVDYNVIETIEVEKPDWDVGHLWIEGKIICLTSGKILIKVCNNVYLYHPKEKHLQIVLKNIDLIEEYEGRLFYSRGRELFKGIIDIKKGEIDDEVLF